MNTKVYWTITAWHVKQNMSDEEYCIGTKDPIYNEKDAKESYRSWAKIYDNVTLTKHVEKQIVVMTTCDKDNKTGVL